MENEIELKDISNDNEKVGTPTMRRKNKNEENENEVVIEIEEENSEGEETEEKKQEEIAKTLEKKKKKKKIIRFIFLIGSLILFALVYIICCTTIWNELNFEGYIAVFVLFLVLWMLINDIFAPELVMMTGLAVLLITKVISIEEALSGFSNNGMLTIATLFVVARGIQECGVLKYVLRYILRKPKYLVIAQIRLLIPVSILSAFTNNTPIVAMLIPVIQSWCRQTKFHASKILMPLSFATILGGTCTLIGTSTNLIVVSLIEEKDSSISISFFEIGIIGIPVAIAGFIYILLFSDCLLPKRSVGAESFTNNPREFTAAVIIQQNSSVVGKTIEQAGLRNLPNVYLYEIERNGEIIPAPTGRYVLNANDTIFFAGVITSMKTVYEMDGLIPAGSDQVKKLLSKSSDHIIVEAVVSVRSPIIGKTVKECRFRRNYNAAIISIHRHGTRINTRIGDIVLDAGDVLLLETDQAFINNNKNNSNFSLVSRVEGMDTVMPKQDILNMLYVILPACIMVVASIMDLASLFATSLVVGLLYIMTKRITLLQAYSSIKYDLLIIIAAGLAIGIGLQNSKASTVIANSLLPVFQIFGGSFGVLTGLFILTAFLSSFITNAAAITLIFPVAFEFIETTGVPVKSVLFCLMIAASSSYSTSVGYQTNLLVSAPGGYTSVDFAKFGLPLTIIAGIITVPLCYFIFGFLLTG